MGYSVKWVNDNLGITRDMLRYYEKEKLLPKNKKASFIIKLDTFDKK